MHWTAPAKGGARAVITGGSGPNVAPGLQVVPQRSRTDTHPAELIAAAHAGSFSRTLAQELGRAALRMGDILTSVAVTLEHLAAGWTIMTVHLDVVARLPHVEHGRFIDATVRAKTNCLVSRALRATISMNARLEK